MFVLTAAGQPTVDGGNHRGGAEAPEPILCIHAAVETRVGRAGALGVAVMVTAGRQLTRDGSLTSLGLVSARNPDETPRPACQDRDTRRIITVTSGKMQRGEEEEDRICNES